MSGHARLSPSAYDRWANCPGSIQAEEASGIADSSSKYADEGTCAHWVLEQVLRPRYEDDVQLATHARHFVGKEVNVADESEEPRYVVVSADMAEHVQGVVGYVEQRRQALNATRVLAERRYSLQAVFGDTDSDGTADVTIVSPTCLEIVDLKYGVGVKEEVAGKGQTKLYLVGAVCEFGNGFSVFRHTIAQPRNGGINSEDLSFEQLREFVNGTADKRRAARVPGAPRIPGEKQCRWCKARPVCREAADHASAALPASRPIYTQQEMFPDPDTLTPDQLVKLLDNANFIRGFLTACEEYAHQLLLSGNAPAVLAGAYKLVENRTRRRWASRRCARPCRPAWACRATQAIPRCAKRSARRSGASWSRSQPVVTCRRTRNAPRRQMSPASQRGFVRSRRGRQTR